MIDISAIQAQTTAPEAYEEAMKRHDLPEIPQKYCLDLQRMSAGLKWFLPLIKMSGDIAAQGCRI